MPVPAFELLESKLRPPHGRAGTVPRSQLIDLLEPESGAVPVIFISAGPGWGKTTLLTQWAARSQRPFAWVSVDANDNDPIVLLTYVATALDRVSRLDLERVRGTDVTRRLDRGNGRPAPREGPGDDGRGGRPRLRRSPSARQPAVLGRHRRAREACARGLAAGALGPGAARFAAGGAAGARPGAGDPGQTSCVWTRPRRTSCLAQPAWTWRTTRSPSSRSTRRVGPRVSTSRRSRPTRAERA